MFVLFAMLIVKLILLHEILPRTDCLGLLISSLLSKTNVDHPTGFAIFAVHVCNPQYPEFFLSQSSPKDRYRLGLFIPAEYHNGINCRLVIRTMSV